MNEVVKTTAEICEVTSNSALEAIERASVDMQITTAHIPAFHLTLQERIALGNGLDEEPLKS